MIVKFSGYGKPTYLILSKLKTLSVPCIFYVWVRFWDDRTSAISYFFWAFDFFLLCLFCSLQPFESWTVIFVFRCYCLDWVVLMQFIYCWVWSWWFIILLTFVISLIEGSWSPRSSDLSGLNSSPFILLNWFLSLNRLGWLIYWFWEPKIAPSILLLTPAWSRSLFLKLYLAIAFWWASLPILTILLLEPLFDDINRVDGIWTAVIGAFWILVWL